MDIKLGGREIKYLIQGNLVTHTDEFMVQPGFSFYVIDHYLMVFKVERSDFGVSFSSQ